MRRSTRAARRSRMPDKPAAAAVIAHHARRRLRTALGRPLDGVGERRVAGCRRRRRPAHRVRPAARSRLRSRRRRRGALLAASPARCSTAAPARCATCSATARSKFLAAREAPAPQQEGPARPRDACAGGACGDGQPVRGDARTRRSPPIAPPPTARTTRRYCRKRRRRSSATSPTRPRRPVRRSLTITPVRSPARRLQARSATPSTKARRREAALCRP